MSKHNYSQYSNTKKNYQADENIETVVQPAVTEPQVEETVAIPEVTPIEGTIVGCAKLNVRANRSLNAPIVCVINVNDKVVIDPVKSNKDWFRVTTADGDKGYCMRKFVNANL